MLQTTQSSNAFGQSYHFSPLSASGQRLHCEIELGRDPWNYHLGRNCGARCDDGQPEIEQADLGFLSKSVESHHAQPESHTDFRSRDTKPEADQTLEAPLLTTHIDETARVHVLTNDWLVKATNSQPLFLTGEASK